MASKKTKTSGINLLKGLSGSKLMKLASLVIVLLAIPMTVLMLQQQQNLKQEAALDPMYSVPVVTKISAEARDIVTWTDGTKRAKVYLAAWAYDSKGRKVEVTFRIRTQGSCVNPLTSSWLPKTSSGMYTYTAQGLQIGKVYEYSAKARIPITSGSVYSNGLTFCGTTGWYPAKKFKVDSNYNLIKY